MSLVEQPREPAAPSIPDMPLHNKQQLDEPSYRPAHSVSGSTASPSLPSDNDDSDFTDHLTESESESESDSDDAADDADADADMMPADKHVVIARAIPALPVKSSLRASRLLDDLAPLKMEADEQPVLSSQAAPHAMYLSSEEDASSSADDFSDFDFESDGEDSPVSRSSHEIMARVVSVIFSGKPSIIEVMPRSPTSPQSTISPRPQVQRTNTDSLFPRNTSISSVASSTQPTRHSTFVTSEELEKSRPQFLAMDPFPSPPEEQGSLPKSPVGTRFRRTFSISRKRSSNALDQALYAQERPSTQTLRTEEENYTHEKLASPRAPANYQEVLRAPRNGGQNTSAMGSSDTASIATSPTDDKPRSRFRTGFMRRRGLKA